MMLIVYILCALSSLICWVLLRRGYTQSRARLLYWSSLCFAGLFLNNLLLIVDTQFLPQVDLALVRMLPALLGVGALVYGLVWDTE